MNNFELETYLNQLLKSSAIRDYCPNGMQVEGKSQVAKVVTGVTASQALIDAAIEEGADAILVHHGYFWKGEAQQVVGMKRNRLKALLANDINLYGYHLPLDIHPELGNNAQLAKLFGLTITDGLEAGNPNSVGNLASLDCETDIQVFAQLVEDKLQRKILLEAAGKSNIKTIGLCTGGAQDFIDQAAARGADLYITGEVSERTIHSARELGINFISAGHHATERYGVKALGEYLNDNTNLKCTFIDIDNPA
ncbi:Nif3-like dinuclear metal center hexameric protein [Saccharobesus litoralis]|uniref:GTP cyclohydrolase 1 type 2 homolog n=1 Tax=Saccharobesus litoralis TaxID=2172099 RepID=A0A2S0VTN4_9ALTE|nr:Nif3-like dinuclear metal center hexameric protein [Saccharobesus litoralis]AWB67571.1 Nif3-like dinuclear metal center hexameric protein [Saccharobesus litoralis]